MAKFVVDTSAYSQFTRGDTSLLSWFTAQNQIIMPLIALAELKSGFANGKRVTQNLELLGRFLVSPNVQVLIPDFLTVDFYADIYAELRRTGKVLGANDIWIAALCRQHGLALLTTDNDFKHVPGLKLL